MILHSRRNLLTLFCNLSKRNNTTKNTKPSSCRMLTRQIREIANERNKERENERDKESLEREVNALSESLSRLDLEREVVWNERLSRLSKKMSCLEDLVCAPVIQNIAGEVLLHSIKIQPKRLPPSSYFAKKDKNSLLARNVEAAMHYLSFADAEELDKIINDRTGDVNFKDCAELESRVKGAIGLLKSSPELMEKHGKLLLILESFPIATE